MFAITLPMPSDSCRAALVALATALFLSGCACFTSQDNSDADDPTIVATNEIPAAVQQPIDHIKQAGANTNAAVIRVLSCPSPNFDRRTLPVSMIVLHYTAAPLRESLRTLRNGRGKNRVSAHYLVAENGTIYLLVNESMRAWHAGISSWRNITDVNSASIGIEIVNLGHTKSGKPRPYPKKQIEAVIQLCLSIQSRYDIHDVVGHSDVAPKRKIDPGELFPWTTLSKRGVRVSAKGFTSK